MKGYSYTSTPSIGRTACTEPQRLYRGELYLILPTVIRYFSFYTATSSRFKTCSPSRCRRIKQYMLALRLYPRLCLCWFCNLLKERKVSKSVIQRGTTRRKHAPYSNPRTSGRMKILCVKLIHEIWSRYWRYPVMTDAVPSITTLWYIVWCLIQGCSYVLSQTRLKKHLKGHNFSSDAEVVAAAETWLDG